MSLNRTTEQVNLRDNIEKKIDDLTKKIKNYHDDAVKKKEKYLQTNKEIYKIDALKLIKQKKIHEKLLQQKYELLSRLDLLETGQIHSMLADTVMTPERRELAIKRQKLRQQNGSIPEMFNKACYTKCQKKSWCDPTGLCDTNYYCTPSNRELTGPEPDTKIQRCEPPKSKKTLGGRKMTNKKNKRLMRKRKTYRRKPNKRKTLKSHKRKQTRYRK